MTQVYLIRHCEAAGNIHRRLDGVRDTDITPFGARQISCLARRFQSVKLDALYTSGLTRAVKTAQGIGAATGVAPQIVQELHERNMGIFDGKSWYEVKERYPEIFSAWTADMKNFVLPEGESDKGACARFQKAVIRLAWKHQEATIAIVAHSMVIKAFVEEISGAPAPYGNNTAVSLFRFDPATETFAIEYLNDDSHLSEEMRQVRQRWFEQEASLETYSIRYHYPQNSAVMGTAMPEHVPDGTDVIVEGYEADEQVGHAVFRFEGQTVRIEQIWTRPERRRRNYATELIGEMIYRGKQRGCRQIIAGGISAGADFAFLMQKNSFAREENCYSLSI